MSHDKLQYSTFQFKCKNNYLRNSISSCYFIFKLCFVVKQNVQCRTSSPRCTFGQKCGVMEKPSLYNWSIPRTGLPVSPPNLRTENGEGCFKRYGSASVVILIRQYNSSYVLSSCCQKPGWDGERINFWKSIWQYVVKGLKMLQHFDIAILLLIICHKCLQRYMCNDSKYLTIYNREKF